MINNIKAISILCVVGMTTLAVCEIVYYLVKKKYQN